MYLGSSFGNPFLSSPHTPFPMLQSVPGHFLSALQSSFEFYLIKLILSCFVKYKYRLVGVGSMSSYGHISKFYPESIQAHPSFTTSTLVMNALASGTDNIVSETGVTIASSVTETVTTTSYTDQPENYLSVSSSNSDVYFQTSTQSLTIIEDYYHEVTPDLSCSSSGSTSITFSIGNYNGVTAPTWVIIDCPTGLLKITSPSVSSDMDVSFYINSMITGYANPVQKLIRLKILNWNVSNCQKCNNADASNWNTCNSGYTVNSGSCISPTSQTSSSSSNSNSQNSNSSNKTKASKESSETAKGLSTSIQWIAGLTTGAIVLSNVINSSSISSLWSLLNQLQLLFLLLITGAFIPEDVKTVILGQKFAISPFSYIPLQDIEFYKSALKRFNFNLSNSEFDQLGVESGSSIYNICSFFVTLIWITLLHLIIYFTRVWLNKYEDSEESWWLTRVSKWIINRLFKILTFGYYIRLFLEINQYFLITSVDEIYSFNASGAIRIISLIIAFILFILWLSFIWIPMCLAFYSHQTSNEESKFGEFFNGLKSMKRFKFYTAILISRRTIFVVVLICLVSTSSILVISILSILQLIYILYRKSLCRNPLIKSAKF